MLVQHICMQQRTHTHSVHRNIFIAYLSLFDYKLWFWTLFPFRQNKCFVCAVAFAFAFAFVLSCWSSSFIAVRLRGIVSFLFWGIFCSCTEHTEHSTHYIHAWKFVSVSRQYIRRNQLKVSAIFNVSECLFGMITACGCTLLCGSVQINSLSALVS